MPISFKTADWRSIMQAGVVVCLRVSYFRGSFRLDPGEIGVPQSVIDDPAFARLVSIGRKIIAPAEFLTRMQSIEVAARRAIRLASYRTSFGPFVPLAAWPALSVLLAARERDFNHSVSALESELVAEKSKVLQQFRELFEAAGLDAERIDAYLSMIESKWPDSEGLRSGSRWSVVVFRADPANLTTAAGTSEVSGAPVISDAYFGRLNAEAQGMLKEFAAGFRQAVSAWTSRAAKSLQGKRRITATVAERMRTSIQRLRRIDIVGDIEAQAALAELLSAIGSAEDSDVDSLAYATVGERVAFLAKVAADEAPSLTSERFASIAEDFDPGVPIDSSAIDSAVDRVFAMGLIQAGGNDDADGNREDRE